MTTPVSDNSISLPVTPTPSAPPPDPTPASSSQSSRWGSGIGMWNSFASALSGAAKGTVTGIGSSVSWAFNPIGRGLGTGAASELKKEIQEIVQPNGPLAIQLKQTLKEALLKQPPLELLRLAALLDKMIHKSEEITLEDIRNVHAYFDLLAQEDNKLLKQLAPDLSPKGNEFWEHTLNMIQAIAKNTNSNTESPTLDHFKREIVEDEKKNTLINFKEVFKTILDQNQGALIHALAFVEHALLSEEGILNQLMNRLGDKLNHEEKGLLVQMKKFVFKTLTDEQEGVVAKAMDVVHSKVNGKDGLIDRFEFRLTDEETGILTKAVDSLLKKLLAKDGIFEQLEKKLNILLDKLLAKGGAVDKLDEKLTEQANPLLSDALGQLNQLHSAIRNNDTASIKTLSTTLQPLLRQLTAARAAVFTKEPLTDMHLNFLNALEEKLSAFYGDAPLSQEEMAQAVRGGVEVLNHYYRIHAGAITRTGNIFSETIAGAAKTITDGIQKVAAKISSFFSRAENLPKTIVSDLSPSLSRLENLPKTFVSDLDPSLTRVENLLKTMVDKLLGRDPSTADTTGEEMVSQLLGQAGSILQKMVKKGGQALSKQALSSFASVLSLGLQQVVGKMDDSDIYQQPKQTLNEIISDLSNLPENGSLGALYTHFKRAWQILGIVKINGFSIPGTAQTSGAERGAEVAHSQNMVLLQRAIDSSSPAPQSQDWKSLAQAEKNKLVHNIANFLTIKHILEDVCKLQPTDERFYFHLIAEARKKGSGSELELKKLFFEELDRRKVNFVTRMYAQIQYLFYGRIVTYYTVKASTIYFRDIFKFIDQQKAENFDTLRNQVSTNLTRYLTILGGAYKTVANIPVPTGTLDEMVRTELEKKKANLGFTTKELYSELAQTVLKKATESAVIAWGVRKWIGNPASIVRAIVDKATGSLHDKRGYTHALNSVIREQLDEVWKLLQAAETNGENSTLNATISEGQKAQLSALVKNLFEILHKTQCGTIDELSDLIQGKLLGAKINQVIDGLFIEEVLEKVTNILAVAFQSLVKEDQLQKLIYKFANLVNRSFEIDEEVSEEKMQDEERKVSNRCEQILRLTINSAIQEKLEFSGHKQQKETNRFIQELQTRSHSYFATVSNDLTALQGMEPSSIEARNKIDKIAKEAMDYSSECYESYFQAKGSKVSSTSKNEIGKQHLGLAEQYKPFAQTVAHLKLYAKTLTPIDGTPPPDLSTTLGAGIRAATSQAQQQLQALTQWDQEHIKQTPYVNFSPIDMKGIQDSASEFVYGRVRERLDGFIGFLKREETYRYGLLNHLILIPYTQAMRSGKKS
jgi:hypothetical protein